MGAWITFIVVFTIILLVGLFSYIVPVIHWYLAASAGLRISLFELIRWRIKKLPVDSIVEASIRARQYNIHLEKDQILRYAAEGRDVLNIVTGLITAKKHDVPIDLEKALIADRKGIHLERGIESLVMRSREEVKKKD